MLRNNKGARPGATNRKDIDQHMVSLKIPETQYKGLIKIANQLNTTPTGLVKMLIRLRLSQEFGHVEE